ncbi:NAD(P)-dependent oxidoreductase [Paucibacter sp. XJ19-41]|uniref:NAD(P)-dependent oxidoreductase n=1 Tax=Paucibacter sp. XJ19-41 TaxID=2927824 RepID=UPI00234A6C77|nr:NAD(P)-dependent oxidoreductase [Paucibacter sp. XJ19-41]MDC6169010.1 NAD(P)-dependent oxidoreductase [Paucibacter sp. XJ19-41]
MMTQIAKTPCLLLVALADEYKDLLRERFELIDAPTAAERAAAIAARGAEIELVLSNGATGLRAEEMAAMPRLRLAAAQGAGYENLDVAAAKARGIAVCNGAGTNDSCVADHTLALLLASVRALPQQEKALRAGLWRDALPIRPSVNGRRLGIFGMGTIGRKIARRAQAFEMQIGYHNRSPRTDAGEALYFDSLVALAGWADFLVVAAPGGAATRHAVNAEVLAALGPQGHLVNIARGSLVDTVALAAALAAGQLGGAALDVYESEPLPPTPLLGFPNVILTPHIAGWSPEAIRATVELFIANVEALEAGRPLLTPL